MNYKDIESLSIQDQIKIIKESGISNSVGSENYSYYTGKHDILNRQDRKKIENEDAGANPDGSLKIIQREDTVSVAKLVLNYQVRIVESAVAFLYGSPVSINEVSYGKNFGKNEEILMVLQKALKTSNFNNMNRALARNVFIETKSAKLYFHVEVGDKMEVRSKVLSSNNGDEFYANFNEYGDLDVFLRFYKTKEYIGSELKEVEKYEIYTNSKIIKGIVGGEELSPITNTYQLLPVVFYTQDVSEWKIVKPLIDNQEMSLSKLNDTNDYHSSPVLALFGEIRDMPDKSDQGKILQFEEAEDSKGNRSFGDAKYITWSQEVEAKKLEMSICDKHIFADTQTADISVSTMMEFKPGQVSGSMLKTLLLDPVLKSVNKQEIFSTGLETELNIIKRILSVIENSKSYDELETEIIYNSILPENLPEVIDYLSMATGNKPIMSVDTAIDNLSIIKNKGKEKELLKEESDQLNVSTETWQ